MRVLSRQNKTSCRISSPTYLYQQRPRVGLPESVLLSRSKPDHETGSKACCSGRWTNISVLEHLGCNEESPCLHTEPRRTKRTRAEEDTGLMEADTVFIKCAATVHMVPTKSSLENQVAQRHTAAFFSANSDQYWVAGGRVRVHLTTENVLFTLLYGCVFGTHSTRVDVAYSTSEGDPTKAEHDMLIW